MKRFKISEILLFSALFLFAFPLFSQYRWERLPGLYGSSHNFKDLVIAPNGNIYVGAGNRGERCGSLYCSTNQGYSWEKIENPKNIWDLNWPSYRSFFFTDKYFYINADDAGIDTYFASLYYSSDNGRIWHQNKDFSDIYSWCTGNNNKRLIYMINWDNSIRILDCETDSLKKICDRYNYYPKKCVALSNGKLLLATANYIEEKKHDEYYFELIDPSKCSHEAIKDTFGHFPEILASYNDLVYISLIDGIYRTNNDFNGLDKVLDVSYHNIGMSQSPNGRIFVFQNSIIYYSDDNAENWKQIECPYHNIGKIACESDDVFYSLTLEGVAKYKKGNWELKNKGIEEVVVYKIIFDKDDNLYACTKNFGFLKKKRNSKEWQNIYFDTTSIKKYNFYPRNYDGYVIRDGFSLPNHQLLISTSFGLRKSTDDGKTWCEIPGPILPPEAVKAIKRDTNITLTPERKNYLDSLKKLSLEIETKNYWRRPINKTFQPVNAPPKNYYFPIPKIPYAQADSVPINRLKIPLRYPETAREKAIEKEKKIENEKNEVKAPLPRIPSKILINSKNQIFAIYNQKMYMTNDYGKSWQLMPLPEKLVSIEDFSIDSKDKIFISISNGEKLYRGKKTYTFFSNDNCQNWIKIKGLNDNTYNRLNSFSSGETYSISEAHPYLFIPDSNSWHEAHIPFDPNIDKIYKIGKNTVLISYSNISIVSDDSSNSKILSNSDIDYTRINDIAEDKDGNIYTATDKGIYVLKEDKPVPISFDTTKTDTFIIEPKVVKYDGEIIFYLPTKSKIGCKIIDSKGNEEILVYPGRELPKGIQKIPFNVSPFQPGTYTIELEINGKILKQQFEVVW